MPEGINLWSTMGQGLGYGVGLISLAVFYGIWDRLMSARRGDEAEERADREQLRAELRDCREAKREEAARADTLADRLEVLNLKLDAMRGAIRSLLTFAHDQRHAGNDRIMAAYQAGRVAERTGNGEGGIMPPPLPPVPELKTFMPGE
jgi:hypothetical protein